MTHLKITQAGLTALATTIVGQVIAFVPNLAPDQQILVSAASTVISAVFLLANAIHALIASKVSFADVEQGVTALVKTEVGRVDLNALAEDAVKGTLPAVVREELSKLLASLAAAAPPPAQVVSLQPVDPPPAA